jgi:hypothetical protein
MLQTPEPRAIHDGADVPGSGSSAVPHAPDHRVKREREEEADNESRKRPKRGSLDIVTDDFMQDN